MQPFIVAEQISKSFGKTPALDNISFEVMQNEIVGFIGPDGAGKSTLFEIMTTLLIPDEGRGYINGMDIDRDFARIRSRIGFMPGRFSLYQDLSVEENLKFYAHIFGTSISENYDLIKSIYELLKPFSKRRAGALSGGMKQKLALCCALIHRPLALFLDEPTTGVDPVSRTEFWDNLTQIKQDGIPIVVSTPYMDEAIRCDRVALIHKGKIMKLDTPQAIIRDFPGKVISLTSSERHKPKEILADIEGIDSIYSFGDTIHITLSLNHENTFEKIEALLNKQLGAEFTLQASEPCFEDCFLQLMTEHKHA